MEKMTLKMDVYDEGVLTYGQRVYVVSYKSSRVIFATCPVCKGTKIVVLEGMEFRCPACDILAQAVNRLTLFEYQVKEYIIHKVELKGNTVKRDYGSNIEPPTAYYTGFVPTRGSYYNVEERKFSKWSFDNVEDVDKVCVTNPVRQSWSFLTKSDANRFAKRLHDRQKEMLKEFNATNGTSHQYPFDYGLVS